MSNYSIYERAKAEIESRRTSARAEADYRSSIIREKSEEVEKIDAELSTTGMLIFKTACSGGDITPIKERNKALQARRKEIIVSLGYPEDYTDVKYTCKECSDSGFIDGVRMCSCLRELIVKGRIEASAMGRLIETQSFDNFDLNWYAYDKKVQDKMSDNLAVAKAYVRDFAKRRDNLLLIGSTGTGKTHLSTAIARELIHKGYDVIYDSTQNILSDFESDRFRNNYGREENKSDKYLDCTLLIMDDMGAEFTTQFSVSALYNLLNARQNKGLATIISTNLKAEELRAKYEDRIYSRIIGQDSRVLVFFGKDKRIN